VSRVLDVVAPPRLGRSFRWLLASSWVSNIGDGIALAAGPLLVASQTRNAVVVALAAVLQRLPWLLFGLWAGAVADRLDRRRVVIVADLLRAVVVGVLCVTIVTGQVSIGLVLATMFLYGVAEVFADTTTGTLGAFLFAAGMVWPFVVQVACVGLSVVLVARIATARGGVRGVPDTHVRRDIADGLRWIRGHAPVRTLALVIFAFNITWGAAWSVLVLYSLDRLHMGEVGFGLLTTAAAAGGLVSTSCYGWLERTVPLATLMRSCLLLEVLTHLALALTTVGWLAIAIMVVFGGYAFVWGTVSQAVRQRAVPQEFQGRVGSVYVVGLFLGLVVGQGLGGVIAEQWGLAAPFWFAFVGSGITLVLVWRQLGHIAHADEAHTSDVA
jgi:MFS family permease